MIFRIIAILILLVFYTFYFAKIVIQKKQSIKTNQMGIGNKPKKVLRIERIMSLATVLACVIGVGSIFIVKHCPVTEIRIVGVLVGILGVIFFALATITMKTSWRVGIPEEKISICLMFFNIPLVLVSVWAAVMLHLQILQEEKHMHHMFGDEYDTYKKHTSRYFGKG